MVGGIASVATTPAGAKTDTELVALGNQFDALTRVFDSADPWDDPAEAQFAKLESAILNTQAVTMEGLRVKARAACWVRLGDLTQQADRQQTHAWLRPLSAILSSCSIRSLSSPAPYRSFFLTTSNKSKRAIPGGPVSGPGPTPPA
jgi:hypothetical protein